jgi:hypothetical protein
MKLYMFWKVPLSINRSHSLYTRQCYMSWSFVDSFRGGSEWNSVPSWLCSKVVYKPVCHISLPIEQWITPDDGQWNCRKHVEFHSKINLRISASSWFYYNEICHDARSREHKKISANTLHCALCLFEAISLEKVFTIPSIVKLFCMLLFGQ